MKKITFVVMLSFSVFVHAANVRIVTEDLPPLQINLDGQSPSGAMVEIVNLLLKEAQVSGEIEILPWARSYQIAQEQNNTLIFSMLRDKSREDKFIWIGKLYTINSYLVTLKSRTDIKVNSIAEAKKYSIGSIRKDLAENYLRNNGFIENKNLYLSSNYSVLWQMLYSHRTDLAFTNSVLWEHELKSSSLDPSQIRFVYQIPNFAADLYIAASLTTDKAIIKRLQQALARLKINGQYQAILDKWQL